MNDTLTAVNGIRVGHVTNLTAATGCTVILCPEGTVGGVDQRGGAPGTRETDLLRPMHLVEHVHAVVLSGGSAFGLATADGVMNYLRDQNIGFPTRANVRVPIVPAAILYDLDLGLPDVFPDAQMGYKAAATATNDPVAQGNVGVGTGCRIGALYGKLRATKGGLGSASMMLPNGVIVAALIAVNAAGDVLNTDGSILGGLRSEDGSTFIGTLSAMTEMMTSPISSDNTVIGVVATNAALTKEETNKVAQMAHDGLAQAVKPAHTMFDGDTIFALATGEKQANVSLVGAFAAEVTARAIRNAVKMAETLSDVRAFNA